jgi:hypothetical protein
MVESLQVLVLIQDEVKVGRGCTNRAAGRRAGRRGASPSSAAGAAAGQVGERSSGSSESEPLNWGRAARGVPVGSEAEQLVGPQR